MSADLMRERQGLVMAWRRVLTAAPRAAWVRMPAADSHTASGGVVILTRASSGGWRKLTMIEVAVSPMRDPR